MSLGLLGKKIGMTRIFDKEAQSIIPVTVIDVCGNTILQIQDRRKRRLHRRAGGLMTTRRNSASTSRTSAASRKQAPLRSVAFVSSASKTGPNFRPSTPALALFEAGQ